MASYSLTVIGDLNLDMLLQVPRFPAVDDEVEILSVARTAGGDAANIAVAAARLGGSPVLIACAGADPQGQALIEEVRQAGVNVEAVQWDSRLPNGFAIGVVRPDGQRNLLTYRGANQNLHLEERQKAIIARSRVVHLSDPQPHIPDEILAALRPETWLSLDPGGITVSRGIDRLTPLLKRCRVFLSNRHEIGQLTAVADPFLAAERVRQLGPEIVVIKCGAEGCILVTATLREKVGGFIVSAVDSTGAGDAFDAAFLTALLEDRPLPEVARFANAAGALTTLTIGTLAALPERQAVDEFMMTDGKRS